MAKIKTPNKNYDGTVGGVKFENGQAETDDKWLIAWFKESGYEVNGEVEEENIAVPKDIPDATEEEVQEVKDQLDSLGVKYGNTKDINKLRAKLEEAQGMGSVVDPDKAE